MNTRIMTSIREQVRNGKKSYWVLLDPDDFSIDTATTIAKDAERSGVHSLLIGGSLLHSNHFNDFVASIKSAVTIPVLLFPGDATQLSSYADAVLYLSLVSGRNPTNLIGEHVKAAPVIKDMGLEPLPTAYMLVESGIVSSVEFMSNTRPLPRNKPAIAVAHALAAQYLGMQLIYLEAGSGALQPVPDEMISQVKSQIEIPLIVGGGIRNAATAKEKLAAGADIIVTGNLLRNENRTTVMQDIANVVRGF